jgi:DNA-binding LacI/PurR family transcriptional regulator
MIKKTAFSLDIELNKTSSEPLHLQLSRSIRLQIRQQRPESGTRLISERKMAEDQNLDRSTVHRAYEELIKDGVIEKQPPKKGFFVTPEAHSKLKQPFPAIGVVIPAKFSEYINEDVQIRLNYLNGIIDQAAKFECTIMMIQLPPPEKDKNFIEDWIKHVIDRLDGIIHLGDRGLRSDLPLKMLLDYNSIPQIFISAFCKEPEVGSIIADTSPGALAAAELLCENGHQNIGIITFYPEIFDISNRLCEYESDRRLDKILDCFQSLGLNIMEEWKLYKCNTVEKMEAELRKIYSAPTAPTAFWCINDDIALMAIEALNNIGLQVPEDISIIGYDNLQPNTKNTSLTTIKIPFYSIGCRAVDLLINYHENNIKTISHTVMLPTSLVIKATVSKAKI